MAEVREANVPGDVEAVRRLWLDYLTWGNDEMEARYAFRLPVEETVAQDLGSIAKFQPPDGRLLLAFENGVAIGTASMRRIPESEIPDEHTKNAGSATSAEPAPSVGQIVLRLKNMRRSTIARIRTTAPTPMYMGFLRVGVNCFHGLTHRSARETRCQYFV